MKINFINSLFIIIINNKYIFNLNYYISRFKMLFIYKNNNVKNVILYFILFFIIYRKFYIFYVDFDYYFKEKLRDFLRRKSIIINYNLFISHKFININTTLRLKSVSSSLID